MHRVCAVRRAVPDRRTRDEWAGTVHAEAGGMRELRAVRGSVPGGGTVDATTDPAGLSGVAPRPKAAKEELAPVVVSLVQPLSARYHGPNVPQLPKVSGGSFDAPMPLAHGDRPGHRRRGGVA